MNQRVNPFAQVTEAPVFDLKPKKDRPVEEEAIARIAKDNNFPSRQVPKPRRKPRIHRTGRNQQFNAKATAETIDRFYKLANGRGVPLGELLRLALDALERERASTKVDGQRDRRVAADADVC